MAPIKFEENIKEKLEKRTLQPSSQAWNTLSDRLELDTRKNLSITIRWLGIAASMVGILFIVNGFFNSSKSNIQTPVLVDTETKEVESFQKSNNVKSEESFVIKENNKVEVANISEEKVNSHETLKKLAIPYQQPVRNTNIIQVETQQKQEEIVSNTVLETPSTIIEIAQVYSQEKANKTETDIDALLKKAQQNIVNKNQTKGYSIDARSLLQDVEEDIDESFRDKVFETLKTSYKKVKSAVAERNN